MTKRKSPTPNLIYEICVRQMAAGFVCHVGNGSYRLQCPGCRNPIDLMAKKQREHHIPLALGGADDATNQMFWHDECSKRKTFGDGATTHGSDIGEIAKTKRLEKAREALERGEAPRPKKKIPGRSLSHPTLKRKFDGTVVERT